MCQKSLQAFDIGYNLLCKTKLSSYTVCPGSSDPPEKIFNIFASEKWGLLTI